LVDGLSGDVDAEFEVVFAGEGIGELILISGFIRGAGKNKKEKQVNKELDFKIGHTKKKLLNDYTTLR